MNFYELEAPIDLKKSIPNQKHLMTILVLILLKYWNIIKLLRLL